MIKENRQQQIAIYSRVSSQEQSVEGVSIEAQLAVLRAYAKSQGWEVVEEYVDRGFSGGTDDRPALKRLLTDAGRHRFSIVAVGKLDRFFRNLRLLLNHLHGLEQLGVKFVSTQEGLDTSTPYGKFAVQIMGVIAEFERGRISERVRDSRRYLISQGNWPGGRPLYGYKWLPKERKWEIVPGEVKIVRRIYDLYLKKKIGMDTIAAILNKDGVHTRDGAEWRFSVVRKILTHPGYKGRHRIGIPMPVIIDESTWQKVQEKRENARSVQVDPKGWLLQGMCFCGDCGHVLKCMRKKPDDHRYYACRGRVNRNSQSEKRCNLPYIRADWLERSVFEKVREVLNDSGKLVECINKSLIELEERRKEIGAESMAVDSKLEAIRTKEERLGMAFADGAVSESAYRTKLKRFKNEETEFLKCQRNIDPRELGEAVSLGISIDMVKDVLNRGSDDLSNYDILNQVDDILDALDANISKNDNPGRSPSDIEESDLTQDIQPVVTEAIELQRNQRALLQKFNIKVIVYPNRLVIKGAIPTQILDKAKKEDTARIISSASRGKGRSLLRGLARTPINRDQTSGIVPPRQVTNKPKENLLNAARLSKDTAPRYLRRTIKL
jgi:site-specific DNA recombinase